MVSRSPIWSPAMTDYTMRFVTTRGQVTEYLEPCADDAIAVEKASELGATQNSVVDVWQENRRVAMVGPEVLPLIFSDPPTR
jgi:hypothetical protein